MQFSIDAIYRAIEERFGRSAGTLLLGLIYLAVAVFCVSTIWLLAAKPIMDGLSEVRTGSAPTTLYQVLGASIVTLVLVGLSITITVRVFMGAVDARLASIGVVERASLEFRFNQEPPYLLSRQPTYRIGVFNRGPAASMDTKVFLETISPVNPLEEDVLPSLLQWKGGDLKQNIAAGHERHVELLRSQITTYGDRGDVLTILLSTFDGLGGFEPQDREAYQLRLQATALNAGTTTANFSVRKVGMGVIVERVLESVTRIEEVR